MGNLFQTTLPAHSQLPALILTVREMLAHTFLPLLDSGCAFYYYLFYKAGAWLPLLKGLQADITMMTFKEMESLNGKKIF